MLLLEQNTTRKGQIDKKIKYTTEFNTNNNNKKYKMGEIRDSPIYTKESDGYLSRLYYLIALKSYSKEKNT